MNSPSACFVGQHKGEFWFHNENGTSRLNVVDISMCNEDITEHMAIYEKDEAKLQILKRCRKFTEQNLIINRASIVDPTTRNICETHRSDLGVKYIKRPIRKFPGYATRISGKRKADAGSFRAIPLDILLEIKSVENEDVCIGSIWCRMCRLKNTL